MKRTQEENTDYQERKVKKNKETYRVCQCKLLVAANHYVSL